MAEINILGIAGSLRVGSYNKKLLKVAQKNLPEGMVLQIHDIVNIPLYNADVEKQMPPQAVQELKDEIASADGLLIATPEYNRSIPGVLKNTIDWVSTPARTSPLPGKPLAIMGAGGRLGTAYSQAHLRQVAVANNMYVMNKPEVMLRYAAKQFDEQGELLEEKTIDLVKHLLESFKVWVKQINRK